MGCQQLGGRTSSLATNSTIPQSCQLTKAQKLEYDKAIDKSGLHLGKAY
jgi:hypothetical protein